jgi:hypothetical protein
MKTNKKNPVVFEIAPTDKQLLNQRIQRCKYHLQNEVTWLEGVLDNEVWDSVVEYTEGIKRAVKEIEELVEERRKLGK